MDQKTTTVTADTLGHGEQLQSLMNQDAAISPVPREIFNVQFINYGDQLVLIQASGTIAYPAGTKGVHLVPNGSVVLKKVDTLTTYIQSLGDSSSDVDIIFETR